MKNLEEKFVDVVGYEGIYQVSNFGRVKSLARNNKSKDRFLKPWLAGKGYQQVRLSVNGKTKTTYVHTLVAESFLGHSTDSGLVVDHIDGDKLNNRAENLQIVTNRDNTSTCYRVNEDSFSSDFVGVSYYKKTDRWRAKIYYNEINIHLGYYNNEEDASDAYQKALGELENGTFKIEDYRASFTSKHKGISFHKASQKWLARLTINGKRTYLGYHSTEEEAHQAVLEFNL